MGTKFVSGDLVFATVKGRPHCPAKVIRAIPGPKQSKIRYKLKLLETDEHVICSEEKILSHNEIEKPTDKYLVVELLRAGTRKNCRTNKKLGYSPRLKAKMKPEKQSGNGARAKLRKRLHVKPQINFCLGGECSENNVDQVCDEQELGENNSEVSDSAPLTEDVPTAGEPEIEIDCTVKKKGKIQTVLRKNCSTEPALISPHTLLESTSTSLSPETEPTNIVPETEIKPISDSPQIEIESSLDSSQIETDCTSHLSQAEMESTSDSSEIGSESDSSQIETESTRNSPQTETESTANSPQTETDLKLPDIEKDSTLQAESESILPNSETKSAAVLPQTEIDLTSNTVSQNDESNQENADVEQTIKEMRETIKKLTQDNQKLQQDNQELLQEKERLKEDKQDLLHDKIELLQDKHRLQQDKKDILQDKQYLKQNMEKIQQDRKKLEEDNETLIKEKEKLCQDKENLKEQLDSASNNLSFANTRLDNIANIAEEQLKCGVCLCLVTYPVMLKCKHVFCKGCVANCKKHNRRCPYCRGDVTSESGVEILDSYLDKVLPLLPGNLLQERQKAIEEYQALEQEPVAPDQDLNALQHEFDDIESDDERIQQEVLEAIASLRAREAARMQLERELEHLRLEEQLVRSRQEEERRQQEEIARLRRETQLQQREHDRQRRIQGILQPRRVSPGMDQWRSRQSQGLTSGHRRSLNRFALSTITRGTAEHRPHHHSDDDTWPNHTL